MASEALKDATEAEYLWLIRLNELCDEFEHACHDGAEPLLEEAVEGVPEEQRSDLLVELLALELEYRRRCAECPHPDEYLARFPEYRDAVTTAFRRFDFNASGRNRETELSTRGGRQPARVSVLPSNTRIGDYELLEEIGRGGMGVVYLARQLSLDRIVAVKMIVSGEFADRLEVERFRTEARAAARLRHPNIVKIHEVGEEAGRHFFSMEFIDGPSLAETQAAGPLPPREAARLAAIVAEAVSYAHSQGIIHRDIKPGNVILDRTGLPHVTDFGLARGDETGKDLTATGHVLGTPSFIPPEQATNDSSAIGPASDVYSLGALLYTLLTGRPPFQAASHFDTLNQVIEQEPIAPRRLVPSLPVDLEVICLKCLEKKPAQRFKSAFELADELQRFLRHEPIRSHSIGPLARTWRWFRRRPAWAALFAFIATALVLAGVGLLIHNNELSRLNAQLVEKAKEAQAAEEAAQRHVQRTGDILYAADMRLAYRSLRHQDTRTLTEFLNRHILNDTVLADRRGFEWRYLQGQAHASHRTLLDLCSAQYFVCYSPDHKWILAAGKDAVVRMLNAETGELKRELITGQVEVNGLAFTPDGQELATTGDDGSVCIWNVASGERRLLIPRANPVQAFQVVFVPETTLLACCGADPVIRIFDAVTGQQCAALVGHARTVQSIALGEDDQTLVSASSDDTARLWNLNTPGEIGTLVGTCQICPVLIDLARDLIVTGSGDGNIQTWRLSDRQELSRVRHLDKLSALAMHPAKNLLAAGDGGGSIRIWNLGPDGRITREKPRIWQAHRSRVYSLAFSPDGSRLMSAGADGQVVEWATVNDPGVNEIHFEEPGASDMVLLPDSSLIIEASSKGLVVRDWKSGKLVRKLDNENSLAIDLAGDGKTLCSWTQDGILRIWDTGDWKLRSEAAGQGSQSGLSISPDGRLVAASRYRPSTSRKTQDRFVAFFDTMTGQPRGEIDVPTCRDLAFAPDSQRLAIARDVGVIFWSLSLQMELWRAPQSDIHALVFSPDGKWLVAGGNRDVVIWESQSGSVKYRFVGHCAPVLSAAFSPDGRTLATASQDGVIKLWHIATGLELFELSHAGEQCNKIRFTDDGKHLVALVNGRLVRVFHAE